MNTILFDLDGTLIDSSEGIIKCVLYTLDFYGIKEPDTAKLYRFIGPPLSESFERYYGFSHEKAYEAVQKYRERYNTTGIFECKLYPGVEKCIYIKRTGIPDWHGIFQAGSILQTDSGAFWNSSTF